MSGKPGPDPTVSDDEILRTVVLAYSPALGTSDVAEKVGISRQAMDRHLSRLESGGLLESKKVGPATIWWITDDGRAHLAESETSDSSQ